MPNILDREIPQQREPRPLKTPATLIAESAARVTRLARASAERMTSDWIAAADALWRDEQMPSTEGLITITAADRFLAQGDKAAGIMALSRAHVTYLLSMLPDDLKERIMARLATIPATTSHPDGTVTIN
jgi:hypothetical protein